MLSEPRVSLSLQRVDARHYQEHDDEGGQAHHFLVLGEGWRAAGLDAAPWAPN